jgi:hypothetical protein
MIHRTAVTVPETQFDDNHPIDADTKLSHKALLSADLKRRRILIRGVGAVFGASVFDAVTNAPVLALTSDIVDTASTRTTGEIPMYQLPSGVKYIDLIANEKGAAPEYGQLVSIAYKAYIKLPPTSKEKTTSPQLFDEQSSYLYKHGNGRIIPGLDEGIHTMTAGSKRRIIIPPKLGYIAPGLGPLPPGPFNRNKLNDLLDEMIVRKGGTLVFEVSLLGVRTDEADLGYYQDDALTPEQFELLKSNLQKQAAAASATGSVSIVASPSIDV